MRHVLEDASAYCGVVLLEIRLELLEIRPRVRVLTPVLLALALIGVASIIVYTGVRLSRR